MLARCVGLRHGNAGSHGRLAVFAYAYTLMRVVPPQNHAAGGDCPAIYQVVFSDAAD